MFAGANCFLSINLQEFSLTRFYGRYPAYVLLCAVVVNLCTFFLCEWMVHSDKFLARDPDRIEKLFNEETPRQGADEVSTSSRESSTSSRSPTGR